MVQRNAACPHARARAAQLSRGDRLAKPLTKNPASGDAVGWTHALWREGSSRSAPLRASTIPPLSVHIHTRSPKGGPEKCPIFLSRILPHEIGRASCRERV